MKLILHHLLKDIRAQRWLLLPWALALIVEIVINALVLQPDYDLARRIETLRASPFLGLIAVIAWTVLLARLIQSEPVTGSTSFWLTRPIPPRVYIPSKFIFFIVFILLPSLLPTLFDAILFQAPPEMLLENLKGLLLLQLFGALCVIWLATFTPSLLHFAGTLCVGFLGLVLFSLLSFSLRVQTHNPPSGTSQLVMLHGEILIVGLLASLIVQHWLRRTRVGLGLGIAAILIAFVGEICWPVTQAPAPVSYVPAGKLVHIDFSPDWQKTLNWSHEESNHVELIDAMATLVPIAADKNAEPLVEAVDAQFQVPGESPVDFPSDRLPINTFLFQQQLEPLKMLREKLPALSIVWPSHEGDYKPPVRLFTVNSDLKSNLQGKTGTLVLNIKGQMESLEQKAEIPLNDPHFIARIPGGFIRVRPFDPADSKQLAVWKVAWVRNLPLDSRNMFYVLVDPQNHTATVLSQRGSSTTSSSFSGSSFLLVDSEEDLSLTGDEPLDRMILYIYQTTPGDHFETTLTAPNFTMNPK